MSSQHDIAFKRLFSHPELVLELLKAIPACHGLLPAKAERVNADFITEDGRQRYADMVWKLSTPAGDVLLPLEFQSSPDNMMALRIMMYSGLAMQDACKQSGRQDLPYVLPIVLYSGAGKWPYPARLVYAHRAGLEEILSLQPEQTFIVLDQSSLRNSPIGAVIRLETAKGRGEVGDALKQLIAWPELGPALFEEVLQLILRRHSEPEFIWEEIMDDTVQTDQADAKAEAEATKELMRMVIQGIRSLDVYKEYLAAVKKGMSDGRAQGLEEGLKQGHNEGLQLGRELGRDQGRAEGRAELLRGLLMESVASDASNAARIENASVAEMEEWVRRMLAGEAAVKVLGGGP